MLLFHTCFVIFLLPRCLLAHNCYSCHERDNATDYKICLDGIVSRLAITDCINYTSCAFLFFQDKGGSVSEFQVPLMTHKLNVNCSPESDYLTVFRGCGWDRFCNKHLEEDLVIIKECRVCEPEREVCLENGCRRVIACITLLLILLISINYQ